MAQTQPAPKGPDFERIMLLLAVIKKAADCGMSHAPFVGEAQKELNEMMGPSAVQAMRDPSPTTVPTQDPHLFQTMEQEDGRA